MRVLRLFGAVRRGAGTSFTREHARRWTPGEAALVLCFGAALLRVTFVWETRDDAALDTFIPRLDDAVTWDAARLQRRPGPDLPDFERKMLSAPLKVHTTALAQSVLGEEAVVHRLAAAVLHALRFVLILAIVHRLTGRLIVACAATALPAGLPAMIFADGTLGKSALELTLLSAALFVLIRWRDRPRVRGEAVAAGLGAGLLLGLGALCQRAALLYVIPALAFVLTTRRWPRRLRVHTAASLLAIFVAVVGAWRASRDGTSAYLPRAGVDARIAVLTDTSGTYQPLPGIAADLVGHTFHARLLAEQIRGRPLTASEADRVQAREAWRYARGHPGQVLRRTAEKARAFVSAYETPTELSVPYYRRLSGALALSPVSFPLLLALAVPGAVYLAGRDRHVLILIGGVFACVTATNLLGFVHWRYRLPAVIPCALLAGPGLLAIARRWREHRRPIGVLLVGAGVLIVGHLPRDPAFVAQREALMKNNVRRAEKRHVALAEAERLARAGQRAALPRALALAAADRHTEAYQALEEVVARGGARTQPAAARLVVYRVWLGDYAGAAGLFRAQPNLPLFVDQVVAAARHRSERDALRTFVLPKVFVAAEE